MADSGAPVLQVGEADETWALIRDKVIEERFGPSAVPVPFLEDVASYDLLHVLLQKPGRARSLLGRARPLVPVGALDQLVQHGVEVGELVRSTREYSAEAQGEMHYEEMLLGAGSPCLIHLQLTGMHKKVVFLELRPNQVSLRPDLPWLRTQRSLHLIHQVFYCSGLALAVTMDQTTRTLHLPGPCPLAFCCLKFALSPRGILGPQKPMVHSLPTKVVWVKLASLEPTAPSLPAKSQGGPKGHDPFLRTPRTGKWPFTRHRPQRSAPSHRDPDRHSMSLPLLQTLNTESDSDG